MQTGRSCNVLRHNKIGGGNQPINQFITHKAAYDKNKQTHKQLKIKRYKPHALPSN